MGIRGQLTGASQMEENIIIKSQMQFMSTVFEFSNCSYKKMKLMELQYNQSLITHKLLTNVSTHLALSSCTHV